MTNPDDAYMVRLTRLERIATRYVWWALAHRLFGWLMSRGALEGQQ